MSDAGDTVEQVLAPALNVDDLCQLFLDCARYNEGDDLTTMEEMVKDHPALVETKDEQGRTALHMAAANGHLAIAKLLLAHHARKDVANNEGNTPLHYAAMSNQVAVAALLLENGWSVDAHNRYGKTPLQEIANKNFEEMELILMKHDEKLDSYCAEGATATMEGDAADDDLHVETKPPESATATIPKSQQKTTVIGGTLDDVE